MPWNLVLFLGYGMYGSICEYIVELLNNNWETFQQFLFGNRKLQKCILTSMLNYVPGTEYGGGWHLAVEVL